MESSSIDTEQGSGHAVIIFLNVLIVDFRSKLYSLTRLSQCMHPMHSKDKKCFSLDIKSAKKERWKD